MAENIEELYSNLTSDERFKSLYPTQEEFEKSLQNDPTIDSSLEQLFGVKSASEYLKKKDQSIIQNLGEENSFSLSPLGGQTEQVPQQTQPMVEQPQEGGEQNVGVVEDPYGLQAAGLPPLGYGKSFEGGPQPTKPDPSQNWRMSLDNQIKTAREKNDLNSLFYLLRDINNNLTYSTEFKNFYGQGKFKEQIDQINGIVANLYEKNPSAFGDKAFRDNLTKLGIVDPVTAKPALLQEAKAKNIPTFLPKQPGAPFIQKPLEQRLKEVNTPAPLTDLEKGVVEYLGAYDQQRNGYESFGNVGLFDQNIDNMSMLSDDQKAYLKDLQLRGVNAQVLTDSEKKFDKLIQGNVNAAMEKAMYNLPANFFDNPAIIQNKIEVDGGRVITEASVNPNRKLLFDDGLYMLDDAGNPKVNPIYISNYVDRMLKMPGGLISDKVLQGFNAQRQQFGLDPYTKDDVAKILKPRYERLAKISADQKLETTIVEQRLSDLNIFQEDVQKVDRNLNNEVVDLTKKSQKLVNDFKIEVTEESKGEADRLFEDTKKQNEARYNEYLIIAQNAASPELQQMEYQKYVQQVNANAAAYEEKMAALKRNTEEKFKNYALEIEKTSLQELEAIKKKYGIISDKDENGNLTTAAYRKYREAYKREYNNYKAEEKANSNAMGWRLGDIAQSNSGRFFANAIQSLSAAVGYENNPTVDLLKYLDYVQTKSAVATRPFSEVLETDGFFSMEALKSAVQSTVQQVPNLTVGIGVSALSGNPYIGGSLMWAYESVDQAGQNYRDVFDRTGSILQAENAAVETLQTQILMAPLYAVSMLPFTKGFLSKYASGTGAWGFTKKFGLGLGLEASEEIPVELGQGYLQYKFGTDNPENFSSWLSKNGGTTAIDVLPSIAILGAGSAGVENYREKMTEEAKNRVLATLGRLGMSQIIADAAQVIGTNGVNILPEYLYRTGQIDAKELKDMRRAFGEVVKALPQAQELVRDQDAQKYFVSLASEKAAKQKQMEESQDEAQKKRLEKVIDTIDQKMTDIAVGKPLKITKITFKNGQSIVIGNEEMAAFLLNKNFLDDISEGSITITTQDANINKIVEESKKQYETELEKATDAGGKNLRVLETNAKERGATLKDGNKLTLVAQKATENGQKNTDRILEESGTLQNALNQVAPGSSIVFLNNEEYSQTMDEVEGNKGSVGNFSYQKNDDGTYSVEVQINLDRANDTTVAHEVGHAILLATLGLNPKLFNEMRVQLKRLVETNIGNKALDNIDALLENYRNFGKGEEFLVELAATLRQVEKNLEIGILEKIAKIISDFVARATGGRVQLFDKISTRVDFANFVNGMVETLRTGELTKPIQEKLAQRTAPSETKTEEQTQGEIESKAQIDLQSIPFEEQLAEVYNSFPGIQEIGTIEQYSRYVENIFPQSIVKNVLYHGTTREFNQFSKEYLGANTNAQDAQNGFYFASEKDTAISYAGRQVYEFSQEFTDYKNAFRELLRAKKNNAAELQDAIINYRQKLNTLLEKILLFLRLSTTKAKLAKATEELDKLYEEINSLTFQDKIRRDTSATQYAQKYNISIENIVKTYMKLNEDEGRLLSVVLDVRSANVHDEEGRTYSEYRYGTYIAKDRSEEKDGTIIQNANDLGGGEITNFYDLPTKNLPKSTTDLVIVGNTEQIHILGTEKDIEQFKNFIENEEQTEPQAVSGEGQRQEGIISPLTLEEQEIQQEEVANFVENADETSLGIAVPVNPNQNFEKIQSKSQLGKYDDAIMDGVSFSNELPIKTLKEVAKEYDGRLFIITSDGTGYGIDSEGNAIFGGFGFLTHPKNQEDGVGFASVDVSTVKSTITRIRKIYGNNKVGVLVMIQPPYTTINNSYGSHYFIRSMKQLASNPKQLLAAKNSFKEWVISNKEAMRNLKKEDSKTGKRNTLSALFKLIDSIDANTDVNAFTEEFLKDTTFDSRKIIFQGLIPDRADLQINKNTPVLKRLFIENGFNTENFLQEYGDKTFLTDELITEDKGGFVVGGFEIDIQPEEEMNKLIEELQSKGFVHPLFNGKLPGTNHFALDGIYGVNKNFVRFSKPQRVFDFEKIASLFKNENLIPTERPKKKSDVEEGRKYASDKRDEIVRQNFKNEGDYEVEAVEKIKEKFPPNKQLNFEKEILPDLGYTNLKSARKIKFKKEIGESMGILMDQDADVATDVARGTGFQPTKAGKEALKTAEFTKGFGSKSQLTEPSSNKWSPSLTQAQVDAKLAETGVRTKTENDRLLQETQRGNETQRNNISTYSSFVNGIISKYGKENLANKNILDAGAGLGIGAKAATQAGIANSYKTFEPFPSISDGKWEKFSGTQQPNFTDFGAIENNSQDILVNNAVLNVVPADIRQSIVENIGRVLKPGGQAYVSVRGIKESALMESLAAAKSGKSKNVFLSDSEYYVPGTQGDYQKGFSETELQAYIQDVLGSQYDVQISKEPFWKSNANAPKVLITKNTQAQSPIQSKSQLDFSQIGPEYDAALQQNNGDKVAAFTAVIEKGYTPKRIKEAIGLFNFDENAFKQAQSNIAIRTLDTIGTAFSDRQELIKEEINNNLGNIEAIYEDLIQQGYSNLEIFTAARDMDYLSPQDLIDIFGAQYRETVQKAINTKTEYPADFLDELEEDARTLKVSQKAAQISDVIRETGIGMVDSAIAVDSLLEYLKENGFDQIAIALTEAVKQFGKDRGLFQKGMDWVDQVKSGQMGDKLYTPEAINYAFSVSSELFSQAGRILQLARYFNETNQMALIERQLNQSGVVLTEAQKKTLEALVNDYKAAQKDNKEKLKALEEDWSDQAWEAFNESEKAVGIATIKVAQFLEARKPIFWNERLTSGAARALLGVTTTILSFTSNIENNIWSTNYAARAIQKLRDSLGNGIKGNTLSFSNWKMARKLTSKRMWFDMNTNAKFGVMDTSKGLNRYYDNLAQVNFFKDAIWASKFMSAMVKKIFNKDFSSMTPEEQADAYDMTLVKLRDGSIELRDGKTYTFARSLAWTLGTGPALAATTGNVSLLKNTGGPLFSELTGRIMSYGGDIAFGYMAAQRAMIDYFQNIQGTRYQDGVFGDMLTNADGKLDEKTIRALSEILRADAELYARFEQEGLKRTLLGDNIISGLISLGRGGIRKKIRSLYTENRKEIGGSTLIAEARRELLSGRGLAKTTLQMVDVGLFTLMPFTKVPVNFLGSAIAKVIPYISGPKYVISEGIYQYKNNEFNKKYPIGTKLKTEKERRDYEKAKIDLFSAKRQATYDSAQFVTSLAIYGFAMSAVQAGAILMADKDDEDKDKSLKQFGLRGGLYNASLHWEYIFAGMPSNFLARRGGFAKEGDVILNTNNAGFLGYAMGLYSTVYNSQRKQEADNVMSLFNTQKSAISTLVSSSLSSGIENLPMFQGLARIGEVLNDVKKDKTGKSAFTNFMSGSLSTSMAVFFPSFFSFMSKGNAEMVQSAGEITVRAENPSWPIYFNDVTLRVVQKLNRNVSFENTRNEFYQAQIGPFGEDLGYKVTLAEPGTGLAYLQAFIDPFSIRSFSNPVKEEQKEIQKYRESVDLFGSMTNLALVYEQMTGRPYEWKRDGKTTSFFNVISNPMPNQFDFTDSVFIRGGADASNIYKQFTYQLPNDLYRQELKIRGEYMRTSLRQYATDFRNAMATVQTAVEENRIEDAKRAIVNAFEAYENAISAANTSYKKDYKNQREKRYLIEMKKRNLFTAEELEMFKTVGLANSSGLIL